MTQPSILDPIWNYKQFRVSATNANYRSEASIKAPIIAVLRSGTILHIDYDRTQDGEWLPVSLVRGWIHTSVVELIDGRQEAT
jgi:hypothetical protein